MHEKSRKSNFALKKIAKMKKQMSYADNKNIPFVAIVGETEMQENKVMLKNMKTGEQKLVSLTELEHVILD